MYLLKKMKQINTYLIEKFKISKNTYSKNKSKDKLYGIINKEVRDFFKASKTYYNMSLISKDEYIIFDIKDTCYIEIDVSEIAVRYKHIKIDELIDTLNKKIGDSVSKITKDEYDSKVIVKIYFYD